MAIQPPPTRPGTPPLRAKQARLSPWNMRIARTHRLATQLVGMQLSGANLLALTVSAASVVAGTVSLVVQHDPTNWPLWLSAGIIGLGLALLIEGLTLGSLIRIRLANRAIRLLDEQIEQDYNAALAALPLPGPALPNARQAMRQYRQAVQLIQRDFRRKRQQATRQHRRQRRFSLPFAAMGTLCSAAAGGLFYHTILAGLGQVESLVLATLFPLVVSGTFISSELHKDAQEEAIKEGFGGGALTETAIREETKLRSALAVHHHVLAYLEKPEAEQAIEAGAHFLLHDILTELRDTSRQGRRQVLIPQDTREATRQLVPSEQTEKTTSASDTREDDTTGSGPISIDDTTPPPATQRGDTTSSSDTEEKETLSASATPTVDTTSAVAAQNQNQLLGEQAILDDTAVHYAVPPSTHSFPTRSALKNGVPGASPEEELQHAPPNLLRHDTADASRPRQEPCQPHAPVIQPDAFTGDTTIQQDTTAHHGAPIRLLFTQDEEPAPRSATTTPDIQTTRILSYLATHDHATQREVAQALGVTVRTVQRRLATWKRQQSQL